jgi:hypothetical protein
MRPLRKGLVFGNGTGFRIQLEICLDDRCGRDVIVASGDQQQRGAIVVVKIDGRCGVRIEVGERGLKKGRGPGQGRRIVRRWEAIPPRSGYW